MASAQERTGNLILHAVKAHEGTLGVETLSKILKGSKEKLLVGRKLHESAFFGALFYYPQDNIKHFIVQLLEQGYLQRIVKQSFPYSIPYLALAEKGIYALQNNINPLLEKRSTPQPTKLNSSELLTLQLFQQYKNVSLVAQQRQLAESTIWSHLERAVRLGMISISEVIEESKRKKIILKAKEKLGNLSLKELKVALPEEISYGEMRCVVVEM